MNIAKRLARKLPATDPARPAQLHLQRQALERIRKKRQTDCSSGLPMRQGRLEVDLAFASGWLHLAG